MEAATTPRPVVLVVEDEENIRELVCLHLGLEHYEWQCPVRRRRRRPEARARAPLRPRDPRRDAARPRRRHRLPRDPPRVGEPRRVPLLMPVRRGAEESDKVNGLESGADDYLAKPFGIREFVARVRALLRRGPRPIVGTQKEQRNAARPLTYKQIEMDPARRRVRVHARDVELTSNEFRAASTSASHELFRHRLQPRIAPAARVEGPDVRDGPQRRHADQAAAEEDRSEPGGSGGHPHCMGGRIQGWR